MSPMVGHSVPKKWALGATVLVMLALAAVAVIVTGHTSPTSAGHFRVCSAALVGTKVPRPVPDNRACRGQPAAIASVLWPKKALFFVGQEANRIGGPFGRYPGRSPTRPARTIDTSVMTESTAERATPGSGRVIRLRYAGRCGCGIQLTPGSSAGWDAEARTVTCLDCLNRDAATGLAVPDSGASVPECGGALPSGSEVNTATTLQPGTAGGAAGREYQRRKDKRDEETDALPYGLRKLARRVFNDPQHIRAWQSGERGEIAAARVLDSLAAHSIPALHDRRIPHKRSNIDEHDQSNICGG